MSLDITTCPIFDDWGDNGIDDSVKNILEWGNVQVEYSSFEVGRTKKTTWAYWSMYWEKGVIGMPHLKSPDDEKYARIHAALFVFLWCNKIGAYLADQLCEDYIYRLKRNEQYRQQWKLESRPDYYII